MSIKNDKLFLERHPILMYFMATFLATMILGAGYQFTNSPFVSPQYAPTIGIIIICLMSKDWSIWNKQILSSLKIPTKFIWIGVAFLLPVAIILFSTLIMSFMGTELVAWQDTRLGYLITIITTILGCIFEEIGWRGYLLPKFREKYSIFKSSIGVGILWGAWHLKFAYGIVAFIVFVILMICFSILMSWIYMKTKGNLWYMILFHFGVNIGSVTLLQKREGLIFYGIATIISLLICIPIVIKNKNEFFVKPYLRVK